MKKVWIISIIAMLCISLIGGYYIFDSIFPKAEAISYPSKDIIISISITQNNDVSIEVIESDFEDILLYISNVKPTRAMSVNDYPTSKPYYSISINTSAREYRYYIYKEGSQVYIELPYEGIYRANQQFWDFIVNYYTN